MAESDIKLTQLSVDISLPHVMAARTTGMDRNEEIMSLSPYVLTYNGCPFHVTKHSSEEQTLLWPSCNISANVYILTCMIDV